MKYLVFIILLIFLHLDCKAQIKKDGGTIVSTVYTGTPVLITINQIDEYENGKDSYYSTIIKFTFSSVPSSTIHLRAKGNTDFFDGPSKTLSSKNLRCTFQGMTVDGTSNDISSVGQVYYSGSDVQINSTQSEVMNFEISDRDRIGQAMDIYVKLKFSVISIDDTNPLKSYPAGYYYMESYFWIETE